MPIKFNKKAANSHKVTKQKRRVAKKRAGVAKVVQSDAATAVLCSPSTHRSTSLQ